MKKTLNLMLKPLRFFDVAANLTDESFDGLYYGKQCHPPDRDSVVARAKSVGCSHFLVASGSLPDLVKSRAVWKQGMFLTAGVHPCRAKQAAADPSQYFKKMEQEIEGILAEGGRKLVAVGQCGLDYDRLNYATKQQQLRVFPYHFALAQKYKLPLYLHDRNTGGQFFRIIRQNRARFTTGLLHSFTGTQEDLETALQLGFYIGVNGCSLKTKQNIEVVKRIPLERMMLETDCPYCEVRNSHASAALLEETKNKFQQKNKQKHSVECLVKGRNEPCRIAEVCQIVSKVQGTGMQEVAESAFRNALCFFGLE